VGICTHLGCSPQDRFKAGAEAFEADWKGGFYCPCHGSLFDLAGRVYKNKPAPDNLKVPPYKFLSDTRILIGEDTREPMYMAAAQKEPVTITWAGPLNAPWGIFSPGPTSASR
jgi:Rieske Fe-S protein